MHQHQISTTAITQRKGEAVREDRAALALREDLVLVVTTVRGATPAEFVLTPATARELGYLLFCAAADHDPAASHA